MAFVKYVLCPNALPFSYFKYGAEKGHGLLFSLDSESLLRNRKDAAPFQGCAQPFPSLAGAHSRRGGRAWSTHLQPFSRFPLLWAGPQHRGSGRQGASSRAPPFFAAAMARVSGCAARRGRPRALGGKHRSSSKSPEPEGTPLSLAALLSAPGTGMASGHQLGGLSRGSQNQLSGPRHLGAPLSLLRPRPLSAAATRAAAGARSRNPASWTGRG